MMNEINIAQKWIAENCGINFKGTHSIPVSTSKGYAFMKVVVDENGYMSDFHLFWNKELTINWYDKKNPNLFKRIFKL